MTRLLLILLISVSLQFSVYAQAKPNFAGTWTLDQSRGSAKPVAGAVPTVFVITQNAKLLTLKTGDQALIINLDGSESVNTVMGQNLTLRARWEGAKLVVETKADFQGIPIVSTQTSSLNAKGTELTIETVTQSAKGPQKTIQVFTKS